MGLFDYIKKKPDPVDTSRLPRLGNYGESPGSSLNFQFSRVQNQNSGQKYPSGVDFKPENQVEQRNPVEEINNAANEINRQKSVADRVKDGEDVFKALLDQKYQSGEESIKRQRAAEFWGNLANLFGQTVSSAAGARMFQPIKSNVPAYNQALDRLRDGYNDTLLNYSLANARADREARLQQETIRLKADKDRMLAELNASIKAGLMDKQTAADLTKQAQKANDAKALQKVKDKAASARAAMNNKAAMEREKYRQGEITKRNGTSGTKGKKGKVTYPVVRFGKNGVQRDLNKPEDVAKMYNEGVGIGYFPEIVNMDTSNPTTIDDMREVIMTSIDNKRDITGNYEKERKTIDGFGSSSKTNTKKKIEGF